MVLLLEVALELYNTITHVVDLCFHANISPLSALYIP